MIWAFEGFTIYSTVRADSSPFCELAYRPGGRVNGSYSEFTGIFTKVWVGHSMNSVTEESMTRTGMRADVLCDRVASAPGGPLPP